MRWCLISPLLLVGTVHADPVLLHAEVDPLTFANGGYGGQVGVRVDHLRFAIASFSLHVPDIVSQIGNDGFDERVRPSGAIYGLYYPRAAGRDGFAFGASVRLLRIRYEHDDVLDMEDHVTEVSPEAIVGYQWHPFHNGFYLQPWLALGVTVWRNHPGTVGTYSYDELPISPFFTVNIGWEQGVL
ncbi:MAG TPA: hypothetical protein VGM90_40415 [Kofleriaceae bacterium]